jgi:hypothetical protein
MSVELVHLDGEKFELSDAGWEAVLEVAALWGWRPAEILMELTPPFRVTAPDCAALAAVMEDAANIALRGGDVSADDLALNSLFSTRSALHWRRFAAFCRAGEVTVRAGDDLD